MANLLIGLDLYNAVLLSVLAWVALWWWIHQRKTSIRVDPAASRTGSTLDADPEGKAYDANWFVSDAEQAQEERRLIRESAKRAVQARGWP